MITDLKIYACYVLIAIVKRLLLQVDEGVTFALRLMFVLNVMLQ